MPIKTKPVRPKLRSRRKQQPEEEIRILTFLDMIAPGAVKFMTDHYICGNTFRCCWALREYPTATDEQAILRHLGEKEGVTLRIYSRHVTPAEERKIIENAASKNRMNRANTTDLAGSITAENNLRDVEALISGRQRNKEVLLHCAVFLEMSAADLEGLKTLQTEVMAELIRAKLNTDRLLMRQKEGFQSVMPSGSNRFGAQFERVLPASSVANLFPFNYSGKTDEKGFFIGRDKYGSNVFVDFNRRSSDKTNANILILGNSGQGKSYLLKLILLNLREGGMRITCLDPEHEYQELAVNAGGTFLDLMAGAYIINVLEPKSWSDEDMALEEDEDELPQAFREGTRLSQHLSFLRDFFRSYKVFSDSQIDVIEIMLGRLYAERGITDATDFSRLSPRDYPVLSDLYDLIEKEYRQFDGGKRQIYTAELLQQVLLGIHSMCKGADSRYFNGHTNIPADHFLVFGVKGLLNASQNVKDAQLFNILSYMAHALLEHGNTAAGIDELYLFLSNPVAISYIRAFSKRVRKKDSAVILASQNLEDFDVENIRELTKPLFSIPTHSFLFNAGSIDKKFYINTLQLEDGEFELIRYPQRGLCLYRCGTERYNLMVDAPKHKSALFGTAGGR